MITTGAITRGRLKVEVVKDWESFPIEVNDDISSIVDRYSVDEALNLALQLMNAVQEVYEGGKDAKKGRK